MGEKGAKTSPPVKFSGTSKEDVLVWLSSLTRYFKLVHETPRRWVLVAETYLSGAALESWTHAGVRDASWDVFHACFTKTYSNSFAHLEARRFVLSLFVKPPVCRQSVLDCGRVLLKHLSKIAVSRGEPITFQESFGFISCTCCARDQQEGPRRAQGERQVYLVWPAGPHGRRVRGA